MEYYANATMQSVANQILSFFFLLVLLDVSLQQAPIPQRAVEGISENINIPCSLGRGVQAPFWFINDTAYELFSIPLHFPYIPRVDSFSQLTIPVVVLDFDNTLFQCAIIDENGLIRRGNAILLIVESS